MTPDPAVAQNKQREFMSLLPLTAQLAGLPLADVMRYFNEDQIEARALAIRTAYKHARKLLAEISK